ncbi:kinesin motor domain protein [Ichthyophthirius multifiliis]|uniref:Kinesin-like protein n=1 Tax=Ichthyophthirius multifiliis TaxID=5932 RepID=G0R613_ICHMU|nr:kinesin motor domain protein [Ichthyophthirius multifiliis]EGR27079.1 kinesin motor domain protein [Ichthyophthirius multifiliis]|eukprot:XP_004023963.1 kinesin motor domain protein [Ichthyophthirius multifiliis]
MNQNNIFVAVRKRPLNQKEEEQAQFAQIVEIQNNTQINLLDPEQISQKYNLNANNISKNKFKENHFTFDIVFDENISTKEVYKQTIFQQINDILDGINTTIFAYGATGAGKTYTMIGQKDEQGIINLLLNDLFQQIQNKQLTHNVEIKLAYMEIYNENLRDLLSTEGKNLDLREDPKIDQIQIHGLTEININSINDLNEYLKIGAKNRTKDQSFQNEFSSRSHGIIQVYIECQDKAEGIKTEIICSKLSLVDLAGSEKAWANKSKNTKIEGVKINQSLLTLGNCIQALSENSKGGFIPYRGSKLTRLLKDSLGGNCRTFMIANISGSILCYEDTYNTLLFANRAKNVKVCVQKNIIEKNNHSNFNSRIIYRIRKFDKNSFLR